jgi:hypothetical protein
VGLLPRLRAALTYSNVMATVAVFVALGGGAYAVTLPRNSVGSNQIKRHAVTARKIAKGAVSTSNVKDFSLTVKDFRPSQLPSLAGRRADDADPPPMQGSVPIKQLSITTTRPGRLFVLATLRDSFLTCGAVPCASYWGVYVDGTAVPDTGMRLQASAGQSDGNTFYTLFGVSSPELGSGTHTVTLVRQDLQSPSSVGEIGAQLGALAID